MNWNKIKNDYPAAWEAFEKDLTAKLTAYGLATHVKIFPNTTALTYEWGSEELGVREYPYNNRDLYGFFDERGLIVAVNGSFGSNGLPVFTNHIVQRGAGSAVANFKTFDSRTEAEAAAFERAFLILNNQLLGE